MQCVRRVGGYSWLQSVKITNEVSEPSIGLYFQIENNLEYHPGKDGKRSGRLGKKKFTFPRKVEFKSTLSILPTHLLSLFPLPVSITHCIEKLQQEFLQEEIGEIKFHFG